MDVSFGDRALGVAGSYLDVGLGIAGGGFMGQRRVSEIGSCRVRVRYRPRVTRPLSAAFVDLATRLLYVLAAVALVWVSLQQAWEARLELNASGRVSYPTWLLLTGTGSLAGLLAAIAVRPAEQARRWGLALVLGLLPAAILAAQLGFIRGWWILPSGWLRDLAFGTLLVPPLLLGITLSPGLGRGPDHSPGPRRG